jgi:hypothetical protein
MQILSIAQDRNMSFDSKHMNRDRADSTQSFGWVLLYLNHMYMFPVFYFSVHQAAELGQCTQLQNWKNFSCCSTNAEADQNRGTL